MERGKRGGLKTQENRRRLVKEVESLSITTRKLNERVKSLRFELLLANVREMVHTGVISEVLGNSRETDV